MVFKRLQRLPPVLRHLDLRPAIRQQHFDDFGIQLVVLGQQHAQAAHIRGLRFPRRLLRFGRLVGNLKRQGDRKFGSFAQPAADLDGSAHLVNQALDDSHAQPRALIDAPRVGVLLRKRIKDVRQERLAHADARVADHPAVSDDPIRLADALADRFHAAADLVVLDAVAVDIQKHLPQVQRAAVYVADLHPLGLLPIVFQRNARLRRALLHDGQNIARKLVQIERFVRQHDFAAFQLAHLQHVVNQAEQVVRRHLHLLPVGGEQRDIVRMRIVNLNQADNAVERRSNVVAHAGKEAGLGRVGAIRLIDGGAQLGVRSAQLFRIFLLNAVLPLPVTLRRAEADHLDARENHGIENQRKQHIPRRRFKHRPLRHVDIDVNVPPARHQAEILPERTFRLIRVHQFVGFMRLPNPPQNRCFIHVTADERFVVAGHNGAPIGDDNRAARFEAVSRKQRRNGQPKRVDVFHRRVIIRRDDARRIPPPDGRQIDRAPVRAHVARGISLFRVKRHIQQRRRIQIFVQPFRRLARFVVIRQDAPGFIQQNHSGDVAQPGVIRQRNLLPAVFLQLMGNLVGAFQHAHQALRLAGQLDAVVSVALLLDVLHGHRHLLPRGNQIRMGRHQKHAAQQRQRQQNFHMDRADGDPISSGFRFHRHSPPCTAAVPPDTA